jgi:hypothetical protein
MAAAMSHADFVAACAERGWTVETVSERVLRLTKRSSILLVGAHPGCYAEALERARDADAYAMRHFRP